MKKHLPLLLLFLSAVFTWFIPHSEQLTPEAWHLFVIFIFSVIAVILNILPIITASLFALAFSLLTNALTPKAAFAGFGEDFILLIVMAFLIARGVIKSGLGKRIAFLIIERFGKTSLGLAYSLIAADLLIAPAFPSNTARSGVLFPLVNSLAHDSDSKVADGTRKKLGAYLMMSSMAGLTLSSALWLSAMAANPVGVAIAKEFGVVISYGSWFLGAIMPISILFILIPLLLYKIYPPQIKATPDAPAIAREALNKMGRVGKNEWIMGFIFLSMVSLWALSGALGINKTAVAALGLALLMAADIFTIEDMKHEGLALETFVWFAILYSMSIQLGELGFMSYLGGAISHAIGGLSWQSTYLLLVLLYVLIHYFFVSQSAHMLALFGLFLEVGIHAGVPGELLALMLLFATNFNAIITPQGSSANVIYIGSGYITPLEVYRIGGAVTLLNTFVFLSIGTFWVLFLF
ncbi:MAG: DASS family sodium-coupled anion symporter [Epsilonproteobacteria bacterium]|nr:DASS family sodium-coupled anion symporter [Campylobacterota bacterium]